MQENQHRNSERYICIGMSTHRHTSSRSFRQGAIFIYDMIECDFKQLLEQLLSLPLSSNYGIRMENGALLLRRNK